MELASPEMWVWIQLGSIPFPGQPIHGATLPMPHSTSIQPASYLPPSSQAPAMTKLSQRWGSLPAGLAQVLIAGPGLPELLQV